MNSAVIGVELITEVLAGEFAGVTNCCSVTLLLLSRPPGRSSLVSQLNFLNKLGVDKLGSSSPSIYSGQDVEPG